jgi:hypothetical protein
MIAFDPVIGIASLGSSQLLRRIFKGSIDAAEKEALIAAGTAAARDLERELQERVRREFIRLAEGLKQEVASLYGEGLARVDEILQEAANRNQEVAVRREQIAHLTHEVIPELRRLVDELVGDEAARGDKDSVA